MSEISIENYKVFVFDLDDTLYLHSVNYDYRVEYTKKIREFLQSLRDMGKILCLATHNKSPYHYLNKMDISDLFDEIVYEQKDVSPNYNSIYEYTNKKDMIQEIIMKTNVSTNDIVFFDDMDYNLQEVKSIGVESIKVYPCKGIVLDSIIDLDIPVKN